MASLSTYLRGFFDSLFSHRLLENRSTLIVATAVLSGPLLYIANTDYRAWLSLGPGGLPHNSIGWLVQLLLSPLRAARLDTSCYDNEKIVAKSGPPGSMSYLSAEDIPQRKGLRPSVCRWVLPQRQLDQRSSEEAKRRFKSVVQEIADANSKLSVSTSALERGGPALFINADVEKHVGAYWTRNEIAHLHPLDGSMHLSVAPKDAKLVIERGWGERFGLSGTLLPCTYVMVYAPRSGPDEEAEMKVVKNIIKAAVKFMLGEK